MPAIKKSGSRRLLSQKALKPVPVFKSLEEEANFWGTHDTTEYDLEDSPKPLETRGGLLARVEKRRAKRIAALLKLTPKQVHAMRKTAQCRGITLEKLLKTWIEDGYDAKARRII